MSVLFGPLAALWTRLGARPLDLPLTRQLDTVLTALFHAFVLITAVSLAGLGAVLLNILPTRRGGDGLGWACQDHWAPP